MAEKESPPRVEDTHATPEGYPAKPREMKRNVVEEEDARERAASADHCEGE